MNLPSRFLYRNNFKKKVLFLFKIFRANQITTKQRFNPRSIKNAIIIITIRLLYFAKKLKLTFNSNNVFAIITIMAISPNYHRWEVTTSTNIFKATSVTDANAMGIILLNVHP
jgi:hypothetical protein